MKIVFAAGASGGHVFPALQTAKELQALGHTVIFLTTKGLTQGIIEKNHFEAHLLTVQGARFSSVSAFVRSGTAMVRAIGQALRLLKEIAPDQVVGFGGYAAFPAIIAAFLTGRPALIHEQNVVPGKGNRWAAVFAKKIMISFEKARKYFPSKKTILTGCPCRNEPAQRTKEQIYQHFGLQPHGLTILVIGGSQGSIKINEEFFKATVLLREHLDFQFIHICGRQDHESLARAYAERGGSFFVVPFLEEIPEAYTIADLVIARAGAATVCELLAFRKKALLVPYPFAGGHQKENAKILSEIGLARIIEDQDLTALRLKDEILQMVKEPGNDQEMAEKVKPFFFPDAAKRLAQVIT